MCSPSSLGPMGTVDELARLGGKSQGHLDRALRAKVAA